MITNIEDHPRRRRLSVREFTLLEKRNTILQSRVAQLEAELHAPYPKMLYDFGGHRLVVDDREAEVAAIREGYQYEPTPESVAQLIDTQPNLPSRAYLEQKLTLAEEREREQVDIRTEYAKAIATMRVTCEAMHLVVTELRLSQQAPQGWCAIWAWMKGKLSA